MAARETAPLLAWGGRKEASSGATLAGGAGRSELAKAIARGNPGAWIRRRGEERRGGEGWFWNGVERRGERKRERDMGEESPAAGGGAAAAAAGKPSGTALPRRGKSCKGCLYYSSMLRSRGFNPVCVGIPRSIPQVPSYVVDEPREEAAAQGHDLRQFKYACAGYSMFVVDNKDGRSGEKEGKTLLPYCQGLELLVDSRLVEKKSPNNEPATASYRKEAATSSRQQGQRPGQLTGQDFYARFRKSAGLVASGVAKNLNKTAIYIKENVADILYPDRRPPK